MKQFLLPSFLLLFGVFAKAQITVGDGDFMSAGDTARVSTANTVNNLNYQAAGQDTLWDYSFLTPASQQVDQMISVNSTGLVYEVYYSDLSINSHRSNLASAGTLNISSNFSLFPLTVDKEYNYFYKSSSVYEQTGLGMSIDGIATPVPYSGKDILYQFPLQYGNTYQSASNYSIAVPGLGGFTQKLSRTNVVDGWGSLITPFGTFNVLREVTTLSTTDSFYIDTVHVGFAVPLPEQKFYKWIGNGQKEPLLQITTQTVLGIEVVSSIVYRDSVRNPPPPPVDTTAIAALANNASVFNVFPNPAQNMFAICTDPQINSSELLITDADGREILRKPYTGPIASVDASAWAKGVYLITLFNDQQKMVRRVVIE